MSRRRQHRRAAKSRRHLQPAQQVRTPVAQASPSASPRVVVREANHVERLAYTRSQAALALGISRSTLRRLLPYVDTIEMPWGTKLIPVDALERLVAERRRVGRPLLEPAARGRQSAVAPEVVQRIRAERAAGQSLRQIAASLNADGLPTAHGGERWWPSTVRALLQRAA